MKSCHKDQNRQIHRKQYLGPGTMWLSLEEQLMIAREYLSLDHIALLLKTTGRILACNLETLAIVSCLEADIQGFGKVSDQEE